MTMKFDPATRRSTWLHMCHWNDGVCVCVIGVLCVMGSDVILMEKYQLLSAIPDLRLWEWPQKIIALHYPIRLKQILSESKAF